jgi:hypothetical protein
MSEHQAMRYLEIAPKAKPLLITQLELWRKILRVNYL